MAMLDTVQAKTKGAILAPRYKTIVFTQDNFRPQFVAARELVFRLESTVHAETMPLRFSVLASEGLSCRSSTDRAGEPYAVAGSTEVCDSYYVVQ